MGRRIIEVVLVAFLAVGCFHLPCYAQAMDDHACCSQTELGQACCAEAAPGSMPVVVQPPATPIIEWVQLAKTDNGDMNLEVREERQRPPPDEPLLETQAPRPPPFRLS